MAGRTPRAFGYFAYVSAIEPTAYGMGSTMWAAPAVWAPTTPAPYVIDPCVRVGPSSTTRTRHPATAAGSSTVTGLSARSTVAVGLSARTDASTASMSTGRAESHLATTTTSAIRTFASPGWYAASSPGRNGSARTRWRSGT